MRRFDEYIFTDLAAESGRIAPEDFRHAKYARRCEGDCVIEELTVSDEAGKEESGREIGRYVTVSSDSLKDPALDSSDAVRAIYKELEILAAQATGRRTLKGAKVLVAGLGNRFITADALGPRCADKIFATRHIMGDASALSSLEVSEISVIEPGVLGRTGIESYDLIRGAADRTHPDLIIAIDAMAARHTSRLAATVQLSDAGLSPGHGIGNRRRPIDRESLGVPLISIGSPTVVNSSTLVCDALEAAGIADISPALREVLDNGKSFFVTLNDADAATERLSDVISSSLNRLFGTAALQ